VIKLIIIFLLVFLDYITKKIIFSNLALYSFYKLLPFLDLTHVQNTGIGFGLFSNLLSPYFIIIIALIITIIVIIMALKAKNNIEKWGLILIITGAIANIIDRLINSYVIDFIYINYNDFSWPAFNFADIYITLGVIIIIYKFLDEFKNRKRNNEIQ